MCWIKPIEFEAPFKPKWNPEPFESQRPKKCLHEQCSSCKGTGINKVTGQLCIHHLSCPCPRCTPFTYYEYKNHDRMFSRPQDGESTRNRTGYDQRGIQRKDFAYTSQSFRFGKKAIMGIEAACTNN